MSRLRALLDHPVTFWLLLSLPAIPIIALLAGENPRAVHIAVHPSGEAAARLLIITLALTPLSLIWPSAPILRWLRARRRYLGVAAFAYTAAHLALYLLDKGWVAFELAQLGRTAIWTGWLAFIAMVPPAMTSFNGAVRRLGRTWKPVQRWAYAAAFLTFVHWAWLRGGLTPSLIHFAPLGLLMLWRFAVRPATRAAAAQG